MMSAFRVFVARVRALLGPRERDADLSDEIRAHLELLAADYVRRGLPLPEAERAARREFGSVEHMKDMYRTQQRVPWVDGFLRDFRFGVRLLTKDRGVSVLAILTLAVVIGANTVIYTFVDHLLMRPLPYPESNRLATVVRHYERGHTSGEGFSQSGEAWIALRDNVSDVEWAVVGSVGGVNLLAEDHAAYVQQQKVSARFFQVFGVPPAVGREFTAEEDRIGGPPVAVVSQSLAVRMFGDDRHVVGRQVTLRGEQFTIVGVMPAGFQSNAPADLWTPLRPSTQGEGAGQNYLLVARLKSGVRWPDVSGRVESVGSAFLRNRFRPPPDLRLTMHLAPLQQAWTTNIQQPLIVLWTAVGIVLFIGCVNIAGLMLVRCSGRAAEIATRMALGGGRATIVRQVLTESLALAACGGAAGVALGYVLAMAISTRLQDVISLPTAPDIRVLFVAAAASLLTSVAFGLLPAVQASRTDVRRMLVESGSPAIAGPSRRWPTRLMVVGEVAMGIVLVVGAGLLIRTFAHLTALEPGFDGTNVITGTLSLQDARYETADRVNDLFTRSLERIRQTSGVEQTAVALTLPYERALNQGWRFEGEARNSQQEPISLTYVTPDYFAALRIPLRRGRVFSDRDTAASTPVVVVNEAFARRYSRDADPVGRRVMFGSPGSMPLDIVGVVGDIQQRVTFGSYGPVSVIPAAYVPASQVDDGTFGLVHGWLEPSWIVRTAGPMPTIVAVMKQAIRDIDPQLPFNRFRTLDDVRGEAVLVARLQAALLGALAGMALLLCALGVGGLVAHSVTERRREFGVRVALGASALEILRTAVSPAIVLAGSGAVAGLALAVAGARFLQGLIFGMSVRDPLTFASAITIVIGTACVAALVPALRTLRVDAMTVLKSQ